MNATLKKAGVAGSGFLLYHGFYVFYSSFATPYLVWKVGMIEGFLIMFVFLIIFSFSIVKIYDHSKTDWLLIDKLKVKLLSEQNPNRIIKYIRTFLRNGDLAVKAAILCWDPVVVVLYYRKELRSPKNRVSKKVFGFMVLSAFINASTKAGLVSLIISLWYYILPYLKEFWQYLMTS